MGAVALVGVVGAGTMNMVVGPVTTASKVTHQNMAQSDLMTNARVVVMNAATLTDGGDIDADGYVEPAPFMPTTDSGCGITLPGAGGCLPADIGASLTDPWGTPYAYCVWDHGDPNTSANRIKGEDSTSGAVIALISAGPDTTFQTPCEAYDGDPATNDTVVDPDGVGDDKVRIYTYDGAVAGAGGLWSLKKHTPDTAVISKKLEVGDVAGGTGFAFDTTTGRGEFPYLKTDYLASKSGGSTPVTMASNLALDGTWLSGDGGNEGITVLNDGIVQIGNAGSQGNIVFTRDDGGVATGQIMSDGDAFRIAAGGGDGYLSFMTHNAPYPAQLGTERMRITQDGNVGIGTPNPTAKLQLNGDMRIYESGPFLWLNGENKASGPPAADSAIFHYDNDLFGSAQDGLLIEKTDYNANDPDGGIMFANRGMDGVRRPALSIRGNGHVGIGVSTPDSRTRLHVTGETRIDGSIWLDMNGDGDFGVITEAGLNGIGLAADVGSASNPHLYVATSGNVGIGTTDPQRQLHVAGNIRTDGRSLYFGADQSLRGDGSSALYWYGGHSTVSQMLFMDAEGTTYGRVYGTGDGATFGLLDGDGHWSVLHAKDTYTDFRINNTSEMTLYPTYLHMRNNQIKYVAYPTAGSDAATKQYVDNNIMAGLNCAGGQVPKWNGSAWVCSADNVGDDLGDGGSTAGTLYSKNSSGYGYVGADSNDYIRFDDNGQAFWQINGRWEYQAYPNGFSPYYNAENDLGTPSKRWRDAWLSGELTVSSIVNDRAGGSYDIWIQGGASGASGNARNLAILGVASSDALYINHSNEYTGGTVIGGPVQISGGALDVNNNAIVSSAGTIRDANGGWVRTYGNTGWYNGTYGGGWYMTDSSYLRNYNAKGVYVSTGGLVGVQAYSNSYGIFGQSAGTYGVYGRTTSAGHGGVIGYSGNGGIYGILGHANAYSLYGNGQIYVSSHIRTGGQIRANTICNASGGNCLSQSNLGGGGANCGGGGVSMTSVWRHSSTLCGSTRITVNFSSITYSCPSTADGNIVACSHSEGRGWAQCKNGSWQQAGLAYRATSSTNNSGCR